ncbi:MAG: hypothetical protein JOZ48_13560 [Acidobacteriaceae bacterium]|nr:hypothetical protein [Acidobacteriaceae bacterium]
MIVIVISSDDRILFAEVRTQFPNARIIRLRETLTPERLIAEFSAAGIRQHSVERLNFSGVNVSSLPYPGLRGLNVFFQQGALVDFLDCVYSGTAQMLREAVQRYCPATGDVRYLEPRVNNRRAPLTIALPR